MHSTRINSLLETRIKEERNTSNNDFSYSILFSFSFFCTVHVFLFFRRYCSLFFISFFFHCYCSRFFFFFFSDVEQTLNDNLEFEKRKKQKWNKDCKNKDRRPDLEPKLWYQMMWTLQRWTLESTIWFESKPQETKIWSEPFGNFFQELRRLNAPKKWFFDKFTSSLKNSSLSNLKFQNVFLNS